MKKVFKVVIEAPEDPENIISDRWIREQLNNSYDSFDDYRYVGITIEAEELPVASLSYLQSQPGINPEYKDAILAMEKKVWESGGGQ